MSLLSKSNQTSLSDFETIKKIGKGSFGSVYLVKRKKDSKIYALKSVILSNLPKNQQESSVNEVRILASVHHQNVISYKEAFWDDNTSSLNIVMEYADDGDSYTKIKKMKEEKIFFEEKVIWDYAIQIIQGLKALHDKNIMHRDLKSENIFLTKNFKCKIGDMNVSKVLKEKLLMTQTGTPYYASPEVWMNKPYSFKSDLWSIGCVIYEMCELKTPFTGKDMDDLFINVCMNKVERINKRYSDDLWIMIKKLLEVNVDKRFNCRQFLEYDIVKNKIKEFNEFNDIDNNNEESMNNSLLLNTIIFRDIKDIKTQLPNKKYYNDESTTESNSKKKEKEKEKEKENIITNKKDENILLIKNLRKELENLRHNQEKRKKENIVKDNSEKNLDIKLKNIKFKNNNINKKYKISIPNNFNIHKKIKYIKRRQFNEFSKLKLLNNNKSAFLTNINSSKFNKSPENNDNSNIIKQNKNKINLSFRNLNINNYIYKKNQHKYFTLNTSKDKSQIDNSISYNINKNLEAKIPIMRNIENNLNINYARNNNSVNGKIFNKLKLLNLRTSSENEKRNSKLIKNKLGDKRRININLNFIPNNFQRYIYNNTNNNSQYSCENIHNQTNINNTSVTNSKNNLIYFKKYLNSIKKNFITKNKPYSLNKTNSHTELLEINMDSNLQRIKDILKRNNNLKKFELKNLIKNKSFSQRKNEFDSLNIPKKKLINKKHILLKKIPKCNLASNTNRNNFDIPLYIKQLNTCSNKNSNFSNRNYII